MRRCYGCFRGKDDGEVNDTSFFKLTAHDAREWATACFREVGDTESGRIELVSRTHRAYHRHAERATPKSDLYFCADGIYGIDNEVVRGKVKAIGVLGEKKLLPRGDGDIGVYVHKALGDDLDLWASDGAREGAELAIDIAKGDDVAVDKLDVTDAAARKRFRGIATHTADTEQRDLFCCEPRGSIRAYQ